MLSRFPRHGRCHWPLWVGHTWHSRSAGSPGQCTLLCFATVDTATGQALVLGLSQGPGAPTPPVRAPSLQWPLCRGRSQHQAAPCQPPAPVVAVCSSSGDRPPDLGTGVLGWGGGRSHPHLVLWCKPAARSARTACRKHPDTTTQKIQRVKMPQECTRS